jgi:GH43 family beta-xylosidase
MVYHARGYQRIEGDPLFNPDRHTRAQFVHWKADGSPEFGMPVPEGPLTAPN